MEVKAGYKDTKVGVIPEEWRVSTVAESFEVCNQLRLPLSYDVRRQMDGPYPYYGPTNIQGWINEYRVQGKYALIGEDGDHFLKWESQSMTLLVDGKFNVNNHAHLVRGTKNETEWFYWYFLNRDLTPVLTRQGASRYKLTKAALLQIPCALPPPSEQRAIATALSDVDTLLGALDRLIAKKRDLKQAAMQQLLTGQTRLPGFQDAWEAVILGDVLNRLSNGALYQSSDPSGLPVTRIETIAGGTIDMTRVGYGIQTSELEEYRMQKGDILFSHINSVDHVGKVAIYSGEPPLYHGMNLLLLRVGMSLNSQFLFYWLGSSQGRKKSVSLARQAVSQASINTTDLKRVEILLPSLPEQTAIATVLSDMDAELAALEQRRNKTQALKQAMMQELLTGRTRLV